jgi:hypothetical protein
VLAVWQGETRFVGSHDWHHQWCGGINGDEYADHDGSVVIESCFRQLGRTTWHGGLLSCLGQDARQSGHGSSTVFIVFASMIWP